MLLQPVPRAARAGIAVSRCAPMAKCTCTKGHPRRHARVTFRRAELNSGWCRLYHDARPPRRSSVATVRAGHDAPASESNAAESTTLTLTLTLARA